MAGEGPTDARPYVIRVAVYEGDPAVVWNLVADVVPDDGTCIVSGRYEGEAG